jgi:hypothetical protein
MDLGIAMSPIVKVCGCRPHDGGAAHTGAGVRKPPMEDSVQRNCFELALYTTRDHDCISNRTGSGIRNRPRCRCRLATSAAPPTPSTIDRAIIMLNDCRFWGYASGPSSSGKTLHRFIHYWHAHAARRSALPRERFSPLAQLGHGWSVGDVRFQG